MFWFFGYEACGILALWPGIEPTPPAFEGEVLTHWMAREVPEITDFYLSVLQLKLNNS